MADKLTIERARELHVLALSQRDPVAIQFWDDEVLRLTNVRAHAKRMAQRASDLIDEGERRPG